MNKERTIYEKRETMYNLSIFLIGLEIALLFFATIFVIIIMSLDYFATKNVNDIFVFLFIFVVSIFATKWTLKLDHSDFVRFIIYKNYKLLCKIRKIPY